MTKGHSLLDLSLSFSLGNLDDDYEGVKIDPDILELRFTITLALMVKRDHKDPTPFPVMFIAQQRPHFGYREVIDTYKPSHKASVLSSDTR